MGAFEVAERPADLEPEIVEMGQGDERELHGAQPQAFACGLVAG
jgi:hypothetical protein